MGQHGDVPSSHSESRVPLAPLISVIVPAYNSVDYLSRCLESLVGYGEGVEVIVVDDGSTDQTPALADQWAAEYPKTIRVIHQANAGHGGALNAGIAQATGDYLKVVDSDDWVDRRAMVDILRQLNWDRAAGRPVDMVVSNYVYEKQGKLHKHVIRYRNVLPVGRVFGWESVRRCRYDQYLMMHSLLLRRQVVVDSGLVLPTHTFYVDYLYSFVPLSAVVTMRYLDVDLYRYFIGREDQSVNETVMISRLDQLVRVNAGMVAAMPARSEAAPGLYRYLIHYLTINCIVSSVMMLRSGTPEHLAAKDQLWADLGANDADAARAVRGGVLGRIISLPGAAGRIIPLGIYRVARSVLGFN